jgi:TRAP-type C4-dicarboxylate transport system permease small subunit
MSEFSVADALSPPPDEPGIIKGMRKLGRALSRLEELVLAALLVTLIVLAVYNAYKRHFSPPSPYWPDEIIRYSVFSIGMLGAALAANTGRLMNIDLVVRLFSPKGRIVLRVLTALFTLVVCYLLFMGSLEVRAVNLRLGERGEIISPAEGILVLPVAAILIAIHITLHMLIDAYYLAIGRLPPHFDEAPKAH